jgi:hypothetical protein
MRGGIDSPRGRWVRVGAGDILTAAEKRSIATTCDEFIARILKPRFLPEIQPTQFNYTIDIFGKWHSDNYRLIQRYRSGFPDTLGEEFDSPFTRLEYVGRDRFDISYYRHTGRWWRIYRLLSLRQALETIEEDGLLHPL